MLVLVAVVIGVVGFVTMSLWNWLVPALFSGPAPELLAGTGLARAGAPCCSVACGTMAAATSGRGEITWAVTGANAGNR